MENVNKEDKLAVLWTSGDREVALKMVFMYTYNSKLQGWWEDVTLIIWGPSAKLLSMDTEVIYMGEPLTDYLKNGWKVITL